MESADKNEIEVSKGSVTSDLQTVDFLSHVSHDEMTTTECQTFPDVCSGSPKLKETFLHIRNRLIHLWLESPEILSAGETVIHQSIEAPYNGNVNLMNRIHSFLECQGYIDLGIFKKRKTESSENENVMVVEDGIECESSGNIGIADNEILNSLVEKELPAEDESQIASEEKSEEDSELCTDSELGTEEDSESCTDSELGTEEDSESYPAGLITQPEGVASATECPSFPDMSSASPQEKCLNNYLILTCIFEFLPLSSRNQIRLVCRRWNEACNHPKITKNEVLAIPMPYQYLISDVFSMLMKSKRGIINLNFQWSDQLLFDDCVSRNFWQQRGFKIRYLVFPEGDLNAADIVQVLKCCLNLVELRILQIFLQSGRAEQNIWAKLSDDHVVLNKMTTLYFHAEMNLKCENSTMNEAFSIIFPNVQVVEIRYSYWWEEHECRRGKKERSFLESSIREMPGLMNAILPLTSKLKSLHLRFDLRRDIDGFWEPVKDAVAAVKDQIKIFEVPLRYFIKRPSTCISDLRKLENLTSLTLTDKGADHSINIDILIQVLDSIPELRHFALHAEDFLIADKYLILNRIIASKLESLLVSAGVFEDLATGATKANYNLHNDTLQSLNMDLAYSNKVTKEMTLFLVEHCRSLKAIKLGMRMTMKIWKNVFIHHEHLRGLSVTLPDFQLKRSLGCHECHEKGPEQFYPLCRFQYLEHLKLCIPIKLQAHEKYSFFGFMLPQLKCLEIKFVPYCSEYKMRRSYEYKNLSAFLHAVEEMPLLEYFSLKYWNNVPYSLFLGQCESHNSLKYLLFNCALPKVEDSEFLKHNYAFKVCKSLRCVKYGEETQTLFRNVITKEIEELSNDEETRLLELPSFYWPRY